MQLTRFLLKMYVKKIENVSSKKLTTKEMFPCLLYAIGVVAV
jgi:hypothetical protein